MAMHHLQTKLFSRVQAETSHDVESQEHDLVRNGKGQGHIPLEVDLQVRRLQLEAGSQL